MNKKQIVILLTSSIITTLTILLVMSRAFGWMAGGAGSGKGFAYENNLYFPDYNNVEIKLYQIIDDTDVEITDGTIRITNIEPGKRILYKIVIDNPNTANVTFDMMFADIEGDADPVKELDYSSTALNKPIVSYVIEMGCINPIMNNFNLGESITKIDSNVSNDYADTWGAMAFRNVVVPGLATGDNKYVINCYLLINGSADNYFQNKSITINKLLFINY